MHHRSGDDVASEVSPPARPRWFEPRTFVGSIAFFAGGYLVIQPLMVGLLLPAVGRQGPESAEQWTTFLVGVVALGGSAGALVGECEAT